MWTLFNENQFYSGGEGHQGILKQEMTWDMEWKKGKGGFLEIDSL